MMLLLQPCRFSSEAASRFFVPKTAPPPSLREAGARLCSAASRQVARAALYMALTETHPEEKEQKRAAGAAGIRAAAVDFGGEFVPTCAASSSGPWWPPSGKASSAPHAEEGAVAGAAHEALVQLG